MEIEKMLKKYQGHILEIIVNKPNKELTLVVNNGATGVISKKPFIEVKMAEKDNSYLGTIDFNKIAPYIQLMDRKEITKVVVESHQISLWMPYKEKILANYYKKYTSMAILQTGAITFTLKEDSPRIMVFLDEK